MCNETNDITLCRHSDSFISIVTYRLKLKPAYAEQLLIESWNKQEAVMMSIWVVWQQPMFIMQGKNINIQ